MEGSGGIGRTLGDTRRKRGLSADHAAAETGIPVHFIESLEDDRFEALPAPVYVRGLLRIYATFLDLDPAPLLDQLPPPWREAAPPAAEAAHPAARPGAEPPDALAVLRAAPSAPKRERPRRQAPEPGPAATRPPPAKEAADITRPDASTRAAARRPSDGDRTGPPAIVIDDFALSPEVATAGVSEPRKSPARRLVLGISAAAAVLLAGGVSFVAMTGDDGIDVKAEPSASASATDTATVASLALVEPVSTPTATPSPTPSPTPTHTPTPAPSPTPEATPLPTAEPLVAPAVPADPFGYCKSLGMGTYDCGPGPWRVICTPFGRFIDMGIVPKPIPAEWPGWRETTISGRLENIRGAC